MHGYNTLCIDVDNYNNNLNCLNSRKLNYSKVIAS